MPRDRDRMPGGWKVAGSLLGFLTAIALLWLAWLNSVVQSIDPRMAQLKAEAAEAQRKTDVSVEQIKGEVKVIQKNVEQIEKNVERIERGQQQSQEGIHKILNELRQRGRTK